MCFEVICHRTEGLKDVFNLGDAPPSSLMDSTTSPKVKIVEEKELGRIPWLVTLWA
jgi:hypothetical protein